MGAVDPIAYVGFPPLTAVLGLADAPPRVSGLLTGRWMAESVPGAERDSAFTIRWRPVAGPQAPSTAAPQPVRWRPDAESGLLANSGGRVRLSPDADESTVELFPGALDQPACLEPLVEAALGDALAAQGECFLHAAAVELDGRRPVLIGDSQAGKSTVSVAAAAFGGKVISDDSLLLGLAADRPLVRAARRNVWLRPGSEALVPALQRRGLATERADDGRIRLDRDSCPQAFERSTYPDCLILLRRDLDGGGTSSRALSQAEALAALLRGTSALYLTDIRFAQRRRRLLHLMTAFAEGLPAIELRVGSSLLEATEECLAAIAAALP